jgi:hypothetical protein
MGTSRLTFHDFEGFAGMTRLLSLLDFELVMHQDIGARDEYMIFRSSETELHLVSSSHFLVRVAEIVAFEYRSTRSAVALNWFEWIQFELSDSNRICLIIAWHMLHCFDPQSHTYVFTKMTLTEMSTYKQRSRQFFVQC